MCQYFICLYLVLPACLPACVCGGIQVCVCLSSYLPICLPACLPPSLPPCLPASIPPAGDFMRGDGPQVYEDITRFAELKKLMEEQLEDYNMEPGFVTMGLVLFRDAIEHGGGCATRVYIHTCTYIYSHSVTVFHWRLVAYSYVHMSIVHC